MTCPRRTSGPEDCSKHVTRRQRSSCRRMCCVCVERHTICRWKSVAAVDDFWRPDVCRRRGTEVRGQTKTRRHNMPVCSQRVSVHCGLQTVYLWILIRRHCYDLWTYTWHICTETLRTQMQKSTDCGEAYCLNPSGPYTGTVGDL